MKQVGGVGFNTGCGEGVWGGAGAYLWRRGAGRGMPYLMREMTSDCSMGCEAELDSIWEGIGGDIPFEMPAAEHAEDWELIRALENEEQEQDGASGEPEQDGASGEPEQDEASGEPEQDGASGEPERSRKRRTSPRDAAFYTGCVAEASMEPPEESAIDRKRRLASLCRYQTLLEAAGRSPPPPADATAAPRRRGVSAPRVVRDAAYYQRCVDKASTKPPGESNAERNIRLTCLRRHKRMLAKALAPPGALPAATRVVRDAAYYGERVARASAEPPGETSLQRNMRLTNLRRYRAKMERAERNPPAAGSVTESPWARKLDQRLEEARAKIQAESRDPEAETKEERRKRLQRLRTAHIRAEALARRLDRWVSGGAPADSAAP